jgi:hypothetical protein
MVLMPIVKVTRSRAWYESITPSKLRCPVRVSLCANITAHRLANTKMHQKHIHCALYYVLKKFMGDVIYQKSNAVIEPPFSAFECG